jgi:hypothetical protein
MNGELHQSEIRKMEAQPCTGCFSEIAVRSDQAAWHERDAGMWQNSRLGAR